MGRKEEHPSGMPPRSSPQMASEEIEVSEEELEEIVGNTFSSDRNTEEASLTVAEVSLRELFDKFLRKIEELIESVDK